jgi:hypothetical protein
MKGQTTESDPDELAPERKGFHSWWRNVLGVKGGFSGHHQAAGKFSKLEIRTFISY